jgi:hypothetical protein
MRLRQVKRATNRSIWVRMTKEKKTNSRMYGLTAIFPDFRPETDRITSALHISSDKAVYFLMEPLRRAVNVRSQAGFGSRFAVVCMVSRGHICRRERHGSVIGGRGAVTSAFRVRGRRERSGGLPVTPEDAVT